MWEKEMLYSCCLPVFAHQLFNNFGSHVLFLWTWFTPHSTLQHSYQLFVRVNLTMYCHNACTPYGTVWWGGGQKVQFIERQGSRGRRMASVARGKGSKPLLLHRLCHREKDEQQDMASETLSSCLGSSYQHCICRVCGKEHICQDTLSEW